MLLVLEMEHSSLSHFELYNLITRPKQTVNLERSLHVPTLQLGVNDGPVPRDIRNYFEYKQIRCLQFLTCDLIVLNTVLKLVSFFFYIRPNTCKF
jgi:hypothetical protein